ncbi:MAG: YqgE/AlgH family protein [Bacteroidota bacterium]
MITSSFKPQAGRFLISEPFMADANFQRTVVLLVEHNEEGSLGFVMNRKIEQSLHELAEGMPTTQAPVFMGGPVEQNTLHYVHQDSTIKGSRKVFGEIYWSGDFEDIKSKMLLGTFNHEEILFFVGYSGWGPGQLEKELSEKAWIIAPENPEIIFESNHTSLWQSLLRSLGGKFQVLSNYPIDPSLN